MDFGAVAGLIDLLTSSSGASLYLSAGQQNELKWFSAPPWLDYIFQKSFIPSAISLVKDNISIFFVGMLAVCSFMLCITASCRPIYPTGMIKIT